MKQPIDSLLEAMEKLEAEQTEERDDSVETNQDKRHKQINKQTKEGDREETNRLLEKSNVTMQPRKLNGVLEEFPSLRK